MNPYLIDRPAVISFSGGRTSGFMLRKIIDAFGGTLPDDVRVIFCNTGLEHERTLEFVYEVARQWTPVEWVEYCTVDDAPSFRLVTFASASRNGEPFDALIRHRKMLPNVAARFCSSELKTRTKNRYIAADFGWDHFECAVGIRADEMRRISKQRGEGAESVVTPMVDAKHTLDDVLAFWRDQPFDLMLPWGVNSFGNCVGCFLKSPDKLMRIMREEPQYFAWWAEWESKVASLGRVTGDGALFSVNRPTYAQLLALSKSQRAFNFEQEDTITCACTD